MKKIFVAFLFTILVLNFNIISSNLIPGDKIYFENSNQKLCKQNQFETSDEYQYGQLVGNRLKSVYKIINILFWSIQKNKKSEIFEETLQQKKFINKYLPSFSKELKGLSFSTGINEDNLLAIAIYLPKLFSHGCTTTASTGPATINNETFLTQNFDVPYLKNPVLRFIKNILMHFLYEKIRIKPRTSESYSYAYYGIPVIYERLIMNEKGLGFGLNSIYKTQNKSRPVDESTNGILDELLVKIAICNCKNVSEVSKLWKNANRNDRKDAFLSTTWCDRYGRILVIESTPNYLITAFENSTDITNSNEGILWHTNHHMWLDPNVTGSIYLGENMLGNCSDHREKRASELLNKYYGNISVEVLKSLIKDHGGGLNPKEPDECDICCHPSQIYPFITSRSFIIQPKNLTIYWTNGQPCSNDFKILNCTKYFNS